MNLPQVIGDFHQHIKLINLKSNTSDTDVSVDKTGVGRNTFLSSPHLCFIIVFICDLFVSRDDPLMS